MLIPHFVIGWLSWLIVCSGKNQRKSSKTESIISVIQALWSLIHLESQNDCLTFHFARSLNNHNKFTNADMPQLNFISRLVSKHHQTISTVLHRLSNSKSCNQWMVDLEVFHRWMNWLSLFIILQISKLRLYVPHRAGGFMLYLINNTNN